MRRLITLISGGRKRTIVIRRELPRTKDAGWAVKPYRLEDWDGILTAVEGCAAIHGHSTPPPAR